MFRKLIERLETIVEPQIDSSQYVTHYQPALEYKSGTKTSYAFIIKEDTYLPTGILSNTYTQDILVAFQTKSSNTYGFDITTTNQKLTLDKSLASQRPLLEDLSPLTSEVSLTVNQKGNIVGYNDKEILDKWKPLKEKLLGRYKGKLPSAYINSIGKRIEQKDLFLQELQQAKLFGLLFNGYQQAHQKEASRTHKESLMVHCLSAYFVEEIDSVLETASSKTINYTGSFIAYDEATQSRIKEYLSYFGITSSDLYVSKYTKKVVLNTQTGLPKSVQYDLELTNGGGYIRRKHYELKHQDNG